MSFAAMFYIVHFLAIRVHILVYPRLTLIIISLQTMARTEGWTRSTEALCRTIKILFKAPARWTSPWLLPKRPKRVVLKTRLGSLRGLGGRGWQDAVARYESTEDLNMFCGLVAFVFKSDQGGV